MFFLEDDDDDMIRLRFRFPARLVDGTISPDDDDTIRFRWVNVSNNKSILHVFLHKHNLN